MAQSVEGFVAAAMDKAAMSPLHWRVISLISAGLAIDLVDIAVFGSLVPDMLRTGFAAQGDIALIASATLIGTFVGSLGQGELTDRFGRKTVYQLNLLIFGVMTIAAAFAPNYLWLAAARFVAGIGLGAEPALCFSYAAEYAPARSRGKIMAFVHLIGGASPWPVSILFALAFRDLIGWRGIFGVIGVVSLIIWLLRFSLPESPRWLATHGQGRMALQILERLGIAGPAADVDLTDDAASNTKSDPIAVVFRQYRKTVIASLISFFTLYCVVYLVAIWLPQLMAERGFPITKALTFTFGMTLAYPLSSTFMMFALDRIGRLRVSVTSSCLAVVAALLFASAQSTTMVLITGFCMFFFMQTGVNAMVIFTTECFPTNARASGIGLAFGASKIGAALAPYAIFLYRAYGIEALFGGMAVLLVIAAVATTQIHSETKGQPLNAIAAPTG
jgi:MFS transporter, putative metabolite:H+ symporter